MTEMYEPIIPDGIPEDRMPSLLVNWHLGSRARRHMSRRRFYSVSGALSGKGKGRVLDIGCGWGYNLLLLARRGFDAYGIDIVSNDFHAARRIAEANNAVIHLARADASLLPFPAAAFDAVTSVETFEHIYGPDRPAALREIERVLRPGGIVSLSTPNYASMIEGGKRMLVRLPLLKRIFPPMCYPAGETSREAYHPYRYHAPVRRGAIENLLRDAGFEQIEIRYIIFVFKNLPDALFGPARCAESLFERLPGMRRLGSTMLVTARKPA